MNMHGHLFSAFSFQPCLGQCEMAITDRCRTPTITMPLRSKGSAIEKSWEMCKFTGDEDSTIDESINVNARRG